jgi:hypothetical protein
LLAQDGGGAGKFFEVNRKEDKEFLAILKRRNIKGVLQCFLKLDLGNIVKVHGVKGSEKNKIFRNSLPEVKYQIDLSVHRVLMVGRNLTNTKSYIFKLHLLGDFGI